jgi:hypothetical protein
MELVMDTVGYHNRERAVLASLHWAIYYKDYKSKLIPLKPEVFTSELNKKVVEVFNRAYK